jgi:hypothetical protein
VVRGGGGLKPLSDNDKATIRKQALKTLDARRHPEVVFDAEVAPPEEGGCRLEGTATIAGMQRPLRVRGRVEVRLDLTVPSL